MAFERRGAPREQSRISWAPLKEALSVGAVQVGFSRDACGHRTRAKRGECCCRSLAFERPASRPALGESKPKEGNMSKKQRLPPYIVEFIQTVNRGEVFEVDPVRIPKDWKYERVRIPAEKAAAAGIYEPHWMVTVTPDSFRQAFEGWG